MRTFFTSLFAFIISGFIGGLVVQERAVAPAEMPMVAGLRLPGMVTIIVHWLSVRWRVQRGISDVKAG